MKKDIQPGLTVEFTCSNQLSIVEYVKSKSTLLVSTEATKEVESIIHSIALKLQWVVESIKDDFTVVLNSLEFRKKLAQAKEKAKDWNTKLFLKKVINFFADETNKFICKKSLLTVV